MNNEKIITFQEFKTTTLKNIPFMALFVGISTMTTIVYSLLATPIYESSAVMTQSSAIKDTQTSSSALSEVANFVSGATSTVQTSEEKIAITRILSKEYFEQRIYQNSFLIYCLFEACDIKNFNEINKFFSEDFLGQNSKPYFPLAYRKYRQSFQILSNESLIYMTFQHQSPEVAFNFLKWIIQDSNNYVRDIEIKKATNRINFLSTRLESTRNIELQKLIGALIQKDIQVLALSEESQDFAFETIDRPMLPQERIFPKRSQMAVFAVFLSSFFILSLVIMLEYFSIEFERVSRFNRKILDKLGHYSE